TPALAWPGSNVSANWVFQMPGVPNKEPCMALAWKESLKTPLDAAACAAGAGVSALFVFGLSFLASFLPLSVFGLFVVLVAAAVAFFAFLPLSGLGAAASEPHITATATVSTCHCFQHVLNRAIAFAYPPPRLFPGHPCLL